ncbi:hypothetical protein ISCGN_015157 [Ixodes scapularis]
MAEAEMAASLPPCGFSFQYSWDSGDGVCGPQSRSTEQVRKNKKRCKRFLFASSAAACRTVGFLSLAWHVVDLLATHLIVRCVDHVHESQDQNVATRVTPQPASSRRILFFLFFFLEDGGSRRIFNLPRTPIRPWRGTPVCASWIAPDDVGHAFW